MKRVYALLGLIIAGLAPFSAAAQGPILFPADNYGKAIKTFEENALSDAQLEILMGRNAMFEPVSELGESNPYRRLARSVALLDLLVEDRQRIRHNTSCTATRIAEDLLLTNFHCVPGKDITAIAAQARFGFIDPQAAPGAAYEVDVSPVESSFELDYAILRLKRAPNLADHPPVRLRRHTVTDGESLILIHHPLGQAQRLTRFRCQAGRPAISDGRLIHHCDTQGGSSGAIVLTLDGFAFAGLHFAGVPHPDRPHNVAKPAADLFNASPTLRSLEVSTAPVTGENLNAADRLSEAKRRFTAGYAAEQLKDYIGARLDYQAACDGGEPSGCNNLGLLLEKGTGVTQDLVAAGRFYQQGCDGGSANGCTNLGWLHSQGRGVALDYNAARRFAEQGCSAGSAQGCTNLGLLYDQGNGVTQDFGAAVRLYRQACEAANANGCTNLAILYANGQGLTQDYATSRTFYQRGCDGGHATGCSGLGNLIHGGYGGAKNEAEGTRLLRKGCAEGDQWGCDRLAQLNISRN